MTTQTENNLSRSAAYYLRSWAEGHGIRAIASPNGYKRIKAERDGQDFRVERLYWVRFTF